MTTITLGGKEFTVRYPLNSIRALERETGKSVFQIVDLTSFSIDLMICVIWAGVLHASRLLTVAAVSQWLEDEKDLPALFAKCYEVFGQSLSGHIPVTGDEPEKSTSEEEKN